MRVPIPLLLSITAALSLATTALADKAAETVIEAAQRRQLVLLSDGKNHYVAVLPPESGDEKLFYGDGKRFYLVPIQGYGADSNTHYNFYFVDPRYGSSGERMFERKGDQYILTCGTHQTMLRPVDAAAAQALLASADFQPSPRKWAAYALARDMQGRYYYVDHGRTPATEKQFRLWFGPRGNLKQLKMTNIVSDSEGDIFATRTGTLRLILGKRESIWVAGSKRTALTLVPVEDNVQMIYNELGVYTGEALGTPCDDL